MINWDYVLKLKSERNNACQSFEYAKKWLNNAMNEFRYIQKQNIPEKEYVEGEGTETTEYVDSFLNLVECTKSYYDAKAEFEKLDAEYKRVSRISELTESIDNYIRWISNANYTDYNEPLRKDFEELKELIK